MKKSLNKTILRSMILLFILAAACTPDLNVENLNDPDYEKVFTDAETVELLLAGAHEHLFWVNTWCSPAAMLSTMAGETACAWGFHGSLYFSSIPRTAVTDYIKDVYPWITSSPWVDAYRGIEAAVDCLKFMKMGGQFSGNSNRMMEAYSKFFIGFLYGKMAQLFDQAFIFDETTDLEEKIVPVDYNELMNYAMNKLDEARTICAEENFRIPAHFMPGSSWTSDEMIKLIHSLQAYFTAAVSRYAADRDAVNWASVKAHIENGLTESWMFESTGFTGLWSGWHTYGHLASWMRASYFTIGPADTSGSYDQWINTPILSRDSQSRNRFVIYTPDLRITSGPPQRDADYTLYFDHVGTKIHYRGADPFPSVRGTYHHSMYGWSEFDWYYNIGQSATGMLPMLAVQSLDYILAEANLRLGDKQAAVDLINKYRVSEGGLPAVSADMPTGTPLDKRRIFGETLWSVLKYEKGIQVFGYDPWQAWMDKRGWGTLITGTVLHFPIPARELELLGMPNYTLGGVGNPGGAP